MMKPLFGPIIGATRLRFRLQSDQLAGNLRLHGPVSSSQPCTLLAALENIVGWWRLPKIVAQTCSDSREYTGQCGYRHRV